MDLQTLRKLALTLGLALAGTAALAQSNPGNSALNPYQGSVQAVALTSQPRRLSLDEALRLGMANNLALTLARQQQKTAAAEKLQLVNVLLPNMSIHGETGVHQYNLEAMGFHPASIGIFSSLLPPGVSPSQMHLITKVDTTIGQVNFSQALFNWSGYDIWRAAQHATKAAFYNKQASAGLVVLNVGISYLAAVAARSQVNYAKALLRTDKTLLEQAHQEHLAGVVANLDELRARVQYQAQQQAVISAEDAFTKDKIALKRQIGLAPGQPIVLTDSAPYAQLHSMPIGQALTEAYANRQVLRMLRQELHVAEDEKSATRHERFPTLTFHGNYGITGVSGGVYHGTFIAMGTLSVPIFNEGKIRGDQDVALAQLSEIRARIRSVTVQIDQQVRDSLLDLQTAEQTVSVAKSNVALAQTALDQTQQRFNAGVSGNLPVAEAQSTLAAAQTQYVNSVFQLNRARLELARNIGLIDQQFGNFETAPKSSGLGS